MSKKRRRSKQTTLQIGDRIVIAVTIGGLAEAIGKSTDTIRRYEKTGIFPKAPLMGGQIRYYPLTLVEGLVPIMKNFRSGVTPKAEDIVKINALFNEERIKYGG